MTISLDTSARRGEEGAGINSGNEFEDSSCGDPLDWLRSIGGLPRAVEKQDLSGGVLAKVIEREIIPRLFLAHLGTEPLLKVDQTPEVMVEADSDAFAELVLRSGFPQIMDQVEAMVRRGISLQRIYLDLLAPVARKLGEFWDQDRCTFTDVTLGLARLQQVLREVGRRYGEGVKTSFPKGRIYLVPAPGEQHTFGLSMVEEYFLHAGWETALDQIFDMSKIIQTVSTQHLDVVGFSIGCQEFYGPTMELAERVRKAARNRDIAVMVGGKFISDNPDLAPPFKGVTFVFDGGVAVESAERLIPQSSRSSPILNLS